MAKTLPFAKIELVPPPGLLSSLALLDIHARSIPLDDVAELIPERHLAMEHPAVFPICPANASFVLEDLSGGEAGDPLIYNPVHVLAMNEIPPIPAAHLFQCGGDHREPGLFPALEDSA